MDREKKEAIIDNLMETKRKSHKIEIDLYFKGMDDEAEKIKAKANKISKIVDNLLANIMKQWIKDTSEGVVEELRKTNKKIQTCINEIKKDVETAKNIIKVLGYLDTVIKSVGNLF